jgi:hypothetical protein
MINKFNAPVKNEVSNLISGFNNGTLQKETKPIAVSIINKQPRKSLSQSVDASSNVKSKTKEEIEEEKKIKREKMRTKLGNSTKKLIAIKEEENKIKIENTNTNININSKINHTENVKIKSLANMFEGKIGINLMQKNSNEDQNQKIENKESDMGEKLNKLYGENVSNIKDIELELDDDENEIEDKNIDKDLNRKINLIGNLNNSNTGNNNNTIITKRKITVTKFNYDIKNEKEKENEKEIKKYSLKEDYKPRTITHVKKFKKPDFKLDK